MRLTLEASLNEKMMRESVMSTIKGKKVVKPGDKSFKRIWLVTKRR